MPSQQVRVSMLGGFHIEVDGVAVPASVWRLKKARYTGDVDEGEAAVGALRRLGDPIADVLAPIPYAAHQ